MIEKVKLSALTEGAVVSLAHVIDGQCQTWTTPILESIVQIVQRTVKHLQFLDVFRNYDLRY